jgi:HK97 family phage prohead protease
MLHKQIRVLKDASLGARQIRIVASDGSRDSVGDIMEPSGCDFEEYRSNNIVLAQHDATAPIGNAQIKFRNSRIEALVDFAPEGISPRADEYCGLYKSGVMKAASVGFDPIKREPITGGGWRYVVWKLLELSLVSVPANPNAVLIERRMPAGYAR